MLLQVGVIITIAQTIADRAGVVVVLATGIVIEMIAGVVLVLTVVTTSGTLRPTANAIRRRVTVLSTIIRTAVPVTAVMTG